MTVLQRFIVILVGCCLVHLSCVSRYGFFLSDAPSSSDDGASREQIGIDSNLFTEGLVRDLGKKDLSDLLFDYKSLDQRLESRPPDRAVDQRPPDRTIDQRPPDRTIDQRPPDRTIDQRPPDTSTCWNDYTTLILGQPSGKRMECTAVSLSPATPNRNQTVTVTADWKANECDTCIVHGSAFGSWRTSTAIANFYNGYNETQQSTFSFQAPNTAGSYSIRIIWAFDISAYSDYTCSNLPSPTQCTNWIISQCFVLDVPFNVN